MCEQKKHQIDQEKRKTTTSIVGSPREIERKEKSMSYTLENSRE